MCTLAGLKGNFTNHLGKVTCATRLFHNNFDEQLIMRQTGHRSNAVRAYKRPGIEHDLKISHVLQPPSPKRHALKKNHVMRTVIQILLFPTILTCQILLIKS